MDVLDSLQLRDKAGKKKNFTSRERAFVMQITRTDKDKPVSITDAYRRTYNAAGAPPTVRACASLLYNKPHIQAAVQAVNASLEMERRRGRRSSIAAIETALWAEAKNAPEPRDRISALKELHRMAPKDTEEEDPMEGSAVSKEAALSRLHAILESALPPTLDVTGAAEVLPAIIDGDDNFPDGDPEDPDNVEVVEAEVVIESSD